MSIIDIRNETTPEVTRIRFADDSYGSACFLTKLASGAIVFEDQVMDGCHYALDVDDLPNFIKAVERARALGWAI